MDDQLVNELLDVLEQENRIYESFLKISKSKTNIIVEGKVSELENIVKLEQSLVLQVGRLETVREGLVEKLSAQLNIKPSEITVSELIKHVNKQSAGRLKVYQEKLSTVIGELKNSNDLNSKLIKNSLDFINFSINLVTEVGAANNNYGSSGQAGGSKKRNLFDVKL